MAKAHRRQYNYHVTGTSFVKSGTTFDKSGTLFTEVVQVLGIVITFDKTCRTTGDIEISALGVNEKTGDACHLGAMIGDNHVTKGLF